MCFGAWQALCSGSGSGFIAGIYCKVLFSEVPSGLWGSTVLSGAVQRLHEMETTMCHRVAHKGRLLCLAECPLQSCTGHPVSRNRAPHTCCCQRGHSVRVPERGISTAAWQLHSNEAGCSSGTQAPNPLVKTVFGRSGLPRVGTAARYQMDAVKNTTHRLSLKKGKRCK